MSKRDKETRERLAQEGGLLTLGETAAYARSSERAVRNWIHDGHLAVVRLGRRVLVRRDDLEAMLNRCRSATPKPDAAS